MVLNEEEIMNKYFRILLILFASLVALSGCKGGDGKSSSETKLSVSSESKQSTSKFVFVDGYKSIQNFKFGMSVSQILNLNECTNNSYKKQLEFYRENNISYKDALKKWGGLGVHCSLKGKEIDIDSVVIIAGFDGEERLTSVEYINPNSNRKEFSSILKQLKNNYPVKNSHVENKIEEWEFSKGQISLRYVPNPNDGKQGQFMLSLFYDGRK